MILFWLIALDIFYFFTFACEVQCKYTNFTRINTNKSLWTSLIIMHCFFHYAWTSEMLEENEVMTTTNSQILIFALYLWQINNQNEWIKGSICPWEGWRWMNSSLVFLSFLKHQKHPMFLQSNKRFHFLIPLLMCENSSWHLFSIFIVFIAWFIYFLLGIWIFTKMILFCLEIYEEGGKKGISINFVKTSSVLQ